MTSDLVTLCKMFGKSLNDQYYFVFFGCQQSISLLVVGSGMLEAVSSSMQAMPCSWAWLFSTFYTQNMKRDAWDILFSTLVFLEVDKHPRRDGQTHDSHDTSM